MKTYKRYMCIIGGSWQVRKHRTRRCLPFTMPEGYTRAMALRLLKRMGYIMRENVALFSGDSDYRWVLTAKGFKAMIEK